MAVVVKKEIDVKSVDKATALSLYKTMVKLRTFDENVIRLLQEGRMGGFHHSGIGQEAIATGACDVLGKQDYYFYMHRGFNDSVARGVPMEEIYGDCMGRMCGTTRGFGAGTIHVAYPELGILGQSGTLGASFAMGAGAALSSKLRKTDQVTIVFFGDGTSSRETFHGGMNWAKLYNLPMIFVLENNEYGLSTPNSKECGLGEGKFIADRADGYGIPGFVIDGNDVLLVRETIKEAVERGRRGEGPTFIECQTFRHRGHFEGDPTTYVDQERLKYFKEQRDPIKNFAAKLIDAGYADQAALDAIQADVTSDVLKAIDIADASPYPPEERIFEDLFTGEVC